MELCEGIHQIRMEFSVTEAVTRSVFLYLITGAHCYLIDAGVAGSEAVVAQYMEGIGRRMEEIRGVFLTHAHPDHIGGAGAIKEQSGCLIYASQGERPWVEDIVQQHRARPIPNFFQLVKEGVAVDRILQDGDRVVLEPGLTLEVVGTPGHSADELSYRLCEKQVVFTGDAIPGRGDIPIYVDPGASLASLARLKALPRPRYYCPAWDQVYSGAQGVEVIQQGAALILRIQAAVEQTEQDLSLEAVVEQVCRRLGMEQLSSHPLFRRTVAGHRDTRDHL